MCMACVWHVQELEETYSMREAAAAQLALLAAQPEIYTRSIVGSVRCV